MGKIRGSTSAAPVIIQKDIVSEYTIASFSQEVLFQIFRLLEKKDLFSVGRVCQSFRAVALDDSLWARLPLNLTSVSSEPSTAYERYCFEAALLRQIELLSIDPFAETGIARLDRLPKSLEDHLSLLRQRLKKFPKYQYLWKSSRRRFRKIPNYLKPRFEKTIAPANKTAGDNLLAGWMLFLLGKHKEGMTELGHCFSHKNPKVIEVARTILKFKVWPHVAKDERLIEQYLEFLPFESAIYDQNKDSAPYQIWAAEHFLKEGNKRLANRLVDGAIENYEDNPTTKALRVAAVVKYCFGKYEIADTYFSDKRAKIVESKDIDLILIAIYTKLKLKKYSAAKDLFNVITPLLVDVEEARIYKTKYGKWKRNVDYTADAMFDAAISDLKANQPSTST